MSQYHCLTVTMFDINLVQYRKVKIIKRTNLIHLMEHMGHFVDEGLLMISWNFTSQAAQYCLESGWGIL